MVVVAGVAAVDQTLNEIVQDSLNPFGLDDNVTCTWKASLDLLAYSLRHSAASDITPVVQVISLPQSIITCFV